MFKTYTRLPTDVEAVQFTEDEKDRIYTHLRGSKTAEWEDGKPVLGIWTAHGAKVIVRLSDWIVEDVEPGTYYPVKDSVFQKIYRKKEPETVLTGNTVCLLKFGVPSSGGLTYTADSYRHCCDSDTGVVTVEKALRLPVSWLERLDDNQWSYQGSTYVNARILDEGIFADLI